MRSFASDNNSGVHPLVMDAVLKANDNHAVGYGDDPWTAVATAKIKEVFGEMASPFFVFNGTGANSVALQAVTRPFNSILCAETAHINVDECGAHILLLFQNQYTLVLFHLFCIILIHHNIHMR